MVVVIVSMSQEAMNADVIRDIDLMKEGKSVKVSVFHLARHQKGRKGESCPLLILLSIGTHTSESFENLMTNKRK